MLSVESAASISTTATPASTNHTNRRRQRRATPHSGQAPTIDELNDVATVTSYTPSISTNNTNNHSTHHDTSHNEQATTGETPEQTKQKQQLINEIRRLEKSMNTALSASRDEISILKLQAKQKSEEAKMLELELERVMEANKANETNTNNGERRLKSDSDISEDKPFINRRLSLQESSRNLMNFRRPSLKSDTKFRRPSLGDSKPSFRRPSLGDAKPSFRRPSLGDRSINFASLRNLNSKERDDTSSNGSFSLRGNKGIIISPLRQLSDPIGEGKGSSGEGRIVKSSSKSDFQKYLDTSDEGCDPTNELGCSGDSYMGWGDNTNNPTEEEEEEEPLTEAEQEELQQLQSILKSKTNEVIQLQNRQSSNRGQLSYLQSKLTSLHTSSKSREEKHTFIMEGYNREKLALHKKMERRNRLLNEVTRSINEYKSSCSSLEEQIQDKEATNTAAAQTASKVRVQQLQHEIRTYQIRLSVHEEYTAKALSSFINILENAKNNDTENVLVDYNKPAPASTQPTSSTANQLPSNASSSSLNSGCTNGSSSYIGNIIMFDEVNRQEQRQQLIDKIAYDVDIQLNDLDIMIDTIDTKVEEYKLLTSSVDDSGGETCSTDDTNDAVTTPSQSLLQLAKQCTVMLEDFISSISSSMECTSVVPSAELLNIEFQDSSTPPLEVSSGTEVSKEEGAADMEEYEATEEEVKTPVMSNTAPDTPPQQQDDESNDIFSSILQHNKSKEELVKTIKEEKRRHLEMMNNLQSKLELLTERLEDE